MTSAVVEQPASLATGVTLAVDAVTAEVSRALREAGVSAIVLRGPAIARWLYRDGERRSYRDVDLLVAPADRGLAERSLESLGFVNRFAGFSPGESVPHATEWVRRRPSVVVDLHRTLEGVRASPKETWDALSADADELELGGVTVEVPSRPARALIVALHAAHHGLEAGRRLADLRLALERVDNETWRQAARLADRLDALEALSAGLRLLPDGAELADRLGLPARLGAETALRASGASSTAIGFARLLALRGRRARITAVARKVVPSPAFMRHWSPLARRGRLGIGLAYLWRPLWLLWHAGPAVLAWRRTRR